MYKENTASDQSGNPFVGIERGFAGDVVSAVDACAAKIVRGAKRVEGDVMAKVYFAARERLRLDEAKAVGVGLYGAVYAGVTNALAQRYIYDVSKPDLAELKGILDATRRIPKFLPLEEKGKKLDNLFGLITGLLAHERANDLHSGAWQATLLDQPARGKSPLKKAQELTRDEVAREFQSFKFRGMLLEAEGQALAHYGQLMEKYPDQIRVTDRIGLDRSDVQTLMLDIQTRIAERIDDPILRRAELERLDDELKGVIQDIPDDFEHKGKKFEIQEIYLLRRLIHSVDSGHLMSVNHGTPREDLNPNRGSVDIIFTAAGDKLLFQLKTFKRSVSANGRMAQWEGLDRARTKIEGVPTHLSVLEAESVERAYDSAAREENGVQVSLKDKYSALGPIVDELEPSAREKILVLLGLTEENLAQERKRMEEAQDARRIHEEEMEKAKEQERRRQAEAEERAEALRLENLATEQAKIQAAEDARLAQLAQSRAQREEAEKAKRETQEARQAKRSAERAEAEKLAQEREAEEREKQAKAQKRELAKARAEAKKIGWPPPGMTGLVPADLLVKLGMMTDQERSEPAKFMAAKKKFLQIFGKPKRGAKGTGEADLVPNENFAFVFQSRENHASPDKSTIERLNEVNKK